MSVVVPPKGTRGTGFPAIARRIMRATLGSSVAAFRMLGDRMRVQGRPLLLLTTVGRRSGKPRETLLGWFPDEGADTYLVTATAAGSADHPAWFLNLASHPDQVWVEVGRRRRRVTPVSLEGAERDAAWERIVALAPGYAPYRAKTDRVIPIVRLIPTQG